jgi:hypothetical protein
VLLAPDVSLRALGVVAVCCRCCGRSPDSAVNFRTALDLGESAPSVHAQTCGRPPQHESERLPAKPTL